MNNTELQAWSNKNWQSLPEQKRAEMIGDLREWIPSEVLQDWLESGLPLLFHHLGGGMQIRNRLRRHMKDDELPPVEQPDGRMASNWDDYYMGAVAELLR